MAPLRNPARQDGHLARAWTGWKPVLPFGIKRLGEEAEVRNPDHFQQNSCQKFHLNKNSIAPAKIFLQLEDRATPDNAQVRTPVL
jgi:hypothetical protein